jgi:hypothetical protein
MFRSAFMFEKERDEYELLCSVEAIRKKYKGKMYADNFDKGNLTEWGGKKGDKRARGWSLFLLLLLVEFIIQQELNFDGTSSHLERIT